MEAFSAADANRNFSTLLRRASVGEEIVVTSRGKPVARIVGIERDSAQRGVAKKLLLKRLKSQKISGVRNWTRDELYS